jgi:diguanylate cyclase (GGDEF)-like protein/PAS domain S-box-containing protein
MGFFPGDASLSSSAGAPADARSPLFYQRLLDSLFDGVYFVDRERRITYWNHGAEAITGYRAEEVIGRSCADNLLLHVDDRGTQLCLYGCPLSYAVNTSERCEAEIYLKHKCGHRVPVSVRVAPLLNETGETVGAVEVFSNISAKKQVERRVVELENLAFHDKLSGMANRRYAEMRLDHAVEEARQFGRRFAVIMMDLNGFKALNDLYGHAAGDELIRVLGKTLMENTRTEDLVARWGGDEFLILLAGIAESQLDGRAEQLRNLVRASAVVEQNVQVEVTAAVGATMIRQDDSSASVVQRADEQMYADKKRQRSTGYYVGRPVKP